MERMAAAQLEMSDQEFLLVQVLDNAECDKHAEIDANFDRNVAATEIMTRKRILKYGGIGYAVAEDKDKVRRCYIIKSSTHKKVRVGDQFESENSRKKTRNNVVKIWLKAEKSPGLGSVSQTTPSEKPLGLGSISQMTPSTKPSGLFSASRMTSSTCVPDDDDEDGTPVKRCLTFSIDDASSPGLNLLSTAGRDMCQELKIDEGAVTELEDARVPTEITEGILTRASGPRVKNPSRYAGAAAAKAAKEDDKAKEQDQNDREAWEQNEWRLQNEWRQDAWQQDGQWPGEAQQENESEWKQDVQWPGEAQQENESEWKQDGQWPGEAQQEDDGWAQQEEAWPEEAWPEDDAAGDEWAE